MFIDSPLHYTQAFRSLDTVNINQSENSCFFEIVFRIYYKSALTLGHPVYSGEGRTSSETAQLKN